ncbi:hypothetical protein FIBSPDRAFT_153428 [Athelia psychrophila]|uniref:Uncharacterized protein n=1 Tax=Athelia psychrophila TaxID=1759441 RepID=A0A166BHT6_9AGAM|nr:hypothetical protein FIBSPDRAFT_153428 [Fibularhizoctonia sp. CBS 109695]
MPDTASRSRSRSLEALCNMSQFCSADSEMHISNGSCIMAQIQMFQRRRVARAHIQLAIDKCSGRQR